MSTTMDLYGTSKIPLDMKMISSAGVSIRPPPTNIILDKSYTYIRVPFIGHVRCIKDTNGLWSIFCVYLYWIYGTSTSMFVVLIPAYNDGHIKIHLIYFYLAIAFLCLTSLIRASTLNPGLLPSIDKLPGLEDSSWTYCQACQRNRPWRAHHCRRCRQCVLRMDHHCPWINNCVGEENHYSFILLLFYSFLLGVLSFTVSMLHFWVLPRCVSCDREVFYIKHSIWFMYLLTALGLNMALVMGMQFIGQHFNLLNDKTTLQNMMGTPEEENVKLRTVFTAYKELFGRNVIICWLLPCRGRQSNPKISTHIV